MLRHLSGSAPFLFSLLLHLVAAAGLICRSPGTATPPGLRQEEIHPFPLFGTPLEVAFLDEFPSPRDKTEPSAVPPETAPQEGETVHSKIIDKNQTIKRGPSSNKKSPQKNMPAETTKSGAAADSDKRRVSGAAAGESAALYATTTRPRYAYNPSPAYPSALRMRAVEGVVGIRVKVDAEGRPSEVLLAESSGYRLFDDAALRAVRQWRFIPAQNGGRNISSWVEFPVRFTLTN